MIAFYISSHGFGHLTRCMAIIDELLRTSDFKIYIVCGSKQIEFAKVYYRNSDKVIYNEIETDAGIINKENSLEVDRGATLEKIKHFIENSMTVIEEETCRLKKYSTKLIVTDISVLGFYIAEKIGVKSIGISNFTWTDQYEFFKIDKKYMEFYEIGYKKCNVFYKYPLSLDIKEIGGKVERIGYVCRRVNIDKVERLKKKYGKILFVGVGKSAELKPIKVVNFNGTIFYTEGIQIESMAEKFKLPVNITDTQNYIAASDVVITKAGWGTVAECMISGVKTVLIERQSVIEDRLTIEKLIKEKSCISISEEEIKVIDIEKILHAFSSEQIKIKKHEDNSYAISQKIIREINDL